MLVLAAGIVAIALLLLAATLAWLERSRRAAGAEPELERGWLERLEVEPILIELTDRRTIAGYLRAVHADALVLEHARYLGAELDGPIEMGGEVAIPRDRIAWVQRGVPFDDLDQVA